MDSVKSTRTDLDEAWNHCRDRSRLSGSTLRFRTTSSLPYRSPIPRIQEIHLWRMASDFRHIDVHQGICLSATTAHLPQRSYHKTYSRSHILSGRLEHRTVYPLDLSMLSSGCSMGRHKATGRVLFRQGSATENHHVPSQ